MPNTLTNLIPSLYAGLNTVSRELVGFIPSVTRNASAERAAVGQSITYPIAPSLNTVNIVPAMQVPEPTDRTIGSDTMQITKAKVAEFGFVGEEILGLNNGAGFNTIQADLFAEGLRALVNEIEADLAIEAYLGSSRAYGTSGTTPFATDLSDTAQVRKILDDNGSPLTNRSLILDTTAGARLRTLTQLTKVNEAGDRMTLRDGALMDVHGFLIKESAQVRTPAKGTGASYLVNSASLAVGSTVIPVDTGSGTILAGDIVTFAGHTDKYVVKTALSGGSFVLGGQGLRVAVPDNAAVTVQNNAARNIAFVSSALQLVARAPALPDGGDNAVDSMMLTDPRSGLSFEVRLYQGYRKMRYEVGLAWGVKAVKSADIATLLG